MWQHGCTDVLPTLIAASPERLSGLFRVFVEAMKLDADVCASIPGFHLEGPFISPVDGARGAHPLAHVQAPNLKVWREVQRAAEGKIVLQTLAPEWKGAPAFIRKLRAEGVAIAVAHTMANRAEIAAAAEAGATMSTHLGNGCPQMMHRHANPVMAQLAEDRLVACLIADGIHLPPEVLHIYWRAKGAGNCVIVTDSMAAAGAPPGRYTISDMVVEVGRDRVVRQPGFPNFAGSSLTMDRAVANTVAFTGASLAEVWDASSTLAWKTIGRKPSASSWVIADATKGFDVVASGRGKRVLFA
jgi:N-acetylglucosamine-6-phosphate deacetylase